MLECLVFRLFIFFLVLGEEEKSVMFINLVVFLLQVKYSVLVVDGDVVIMGLLICIGLCYDVVILQEVVCMECFMVEVIWFLLEGFLMVCIVCCSVFLVIDLYVGCLVEIFDSFIEQVEIMLVNGVFVCDLLLLVLIMEMGEIVIQVLIMVLLIKLVYVLLKSLSDCIGCCFFSFIVNDVIEVEVCIVYVNMVQVVSCYLVVQLNFIGVILVDDYICCVIGQGWVVMDVFFFVGVVLVFQCLFKCFIVGLDVVCSSYGMVIDGVSLGV